MSTLTDRRPPWDALLLVSFDRADATDRSLYDRTPTVGSGATSATRCWDFDGTSNAKITYPSDNSLHGVPFSVCCWARIDESVTRVNLVGRNTVGTSPEQYRGWYIHHIGTGAGSYGPIFVTGKNASNYKAAYLGSPGTYGNGAWRHYAWTCSNSDNYSNWKIYINGVDTSFSQTGSGSVSDISNSEALTLGGQTSANQTVYLDGALDDVRIYARALSAAEIAGIYAETVGESRP